MSPVSVIVLTRNRLNKLEKLLSALLPQFAPDDELIIIDTGSTDGTRERFAPNASSAALPGVRFIEFDHPEAGWAEARNHGVDLAVNPFIAFLDDDCYPAPDWLARGKSGLENYDAVGGMTMPHDITDWPEWWDPEMGWLAGLSTPGHLGPEAGRYYYPYTANLWIRAGVARAERFQEIGGALKVENVGDAAARPKHYAAGREDAELWRRLRVHGRRVAFDSDLRVEHDIGRERINLEYLRERARRDGEAWARREGTEADLIPLAYQWWRHAAPAREESEPTPAVGPYPPAGHGARMTYHSLIRERHGAALRALAEKLSALDPHRHSPALITIRSRTHAGVRYAIDRAKTILRRVSLAFSPPRPWIEPAEPPTRIAVAAFGFVGDLIILQGVLRGLLHANPHLSIALLAPPAGEFVFRELKSERFEFTVLPTPEPGAAQARDFLAQWLTHVQPQIVIAPYLHTTWGPALVRLLHAAKRGAPLVAFEGDMELTRRRDVERITRRVRKDLTIHETENLRRLFDVIKVNRFTEVASRLEIGDEARDEAREALRAIGGDEPLARHLIMFNPHAGKPFKEWIPENWGALARATLERWPVTLIVNLARPDAELESEIAKLPPNLRQRILLLRGASLERLAATLALCAGVVTVDSAPQHLAHALDVPSLTLYGPMDERRWADPLKRSIHRTVRGGMFDLTPEELRGLPENHLMRLITAEPAVKAMEGWMGGQANLT